MNITNDASYRQWQIDIAQKWRDEHHLSKLSDQDAAASHWGDDSSRAIPMPPQAIKVYEMLERIFRTEHRYPGYREIGRELSIASTGTVEYWIHRLERAGWLIIQGRGVYDLLHNPAVYYVKDSE